MKTFKPKKNDKVYVCYDGKLGRRNEGIVLAARGFAIFVRFRLYAEEKEVERWFVRTSPQAFGAYVKVEGEVGVMEGLFGMKGEWYSVYSIKENKV